MKKAAAILLIFLLLYSCATDTARLLDEVESYLAESPEAAVTALRSADTGRCSKKLRSRAALLETEALEMTGRIQECDSLIAAAAAWYMEHGSDAMKMKVLYYEGCLMLCRNDIKAAARAFSAARDHAMKAGDGHFCGLICSRLSSLYRLCGNYGEALELASAAYESFRSCGDSTRMDWSRYEMAGCYAGLGQFGRSEAVCRDLTRRAVRNSDTALAEECTRMRIAALLGMDPPGTQQALSLRSMLKDSLRSVPTFQTGTLHDCAAAAAQRDYYMEQAGELRTRLAGARRTALLCSLLGLVTTVTVLSIALMQRKRLRAQAARESEADIRKEYDRACGSMAARIEGLYRLKIGFLDEICRLCFSYESPSTRQRHILKAVDKAVGRLADDDGLRTLEEIVDTWKDGAMRKARKEFSKFREDEFRLLCFWLAGFSAPAISLLTGEEDINAVYRKKSRLKTKIEHSDSRIKDEILGHLT